MIDTFVPRTDAQAVGALAAELLQQRTGWVTRENIGEVRRLLLANVKTLAGVEERLIPGDDGYHVPVRIMRPSGRAKAVVVTMHSSGWCIGAAVQDDELNAHLVERLGVATVAVDYRLAPEHPYPAGLDDVLSVAKWVGTAGDVEFGSEQLIFGGHSAGAHLVAQALIRLRNSDPDLFRRVVAAFLSYGAYDLGETPSMRRVRDDSLVITREFFDSIMEFAFPGTDRESRRDPAISPLYADLQGLPPALFAACTLDPVLDDTLFMAARWEAAGNQTSLDVWPGTVHGFVGRDLSTTPVYTDRVTTWLSARLDHSRATQRTEASA